jgi:hypothetical protein
LRIIIERTIGTLKRRFRIHRVEPEYSPKVQALIIYASAAMMNWMIDYGDDLEVDLYEPDDFDNLMAIGQPNVAAHDWYTDDDRRVGKNAKMNRFRERIALQMWEDYGAIGTARRHRLRDSI